MTVLVLGLLFIPACGPGRQEAPPGPAQVQGGEEELFTSGRFKLLNSGSQLQVVEGLPKYFRAAGWIDLRTIFGLVGATPVVYNLESGSISYPGIPAWSARLSPNRKYFSYIEEGGVYVTGIDGRGNRHIWPPQEAFEGGGHHGGGVWSPSGEKLLVWFQYEWDGEYFVCSLQGEEDAYKLKTYLEGYFLTTAVGWVDEQRLIFNTRANVMKDGTQDYTFGYRSDLAVYDLKTGSFRLISNSNDGEFLEGLSVCPRGIFFLRWFGRNETRDDFSYGLMDLTGRVIWESPFYRSAYFSLSPDGRSTACLVEIGRSELNPVYTLLLLSQGKTLPVAELKFGEQFSEVFWCPEGKKMLISFTAAVPQDDPPDSYRQQHYTLIIEP